jgi:hypothetical protein
VRRDIEPALRELGELSGGELYQMQLADLPNEPILTQWDPWGNRIDQIEVTPLWKRRKSWRPNLAWWRRRMRDDTAVSTASTSSPALTSSTPPPTFTPARWR